MPTLDEELIEILRRYAEPIAPRRRSYFFEEVDGRLAGRTVAPGLLARVCAEVQPRFLNAPPAIDEPPRRPSKPQRAKGPWRRRA